LKQTFENTRDGRLVEASTSLLDISEWLLTHAQDLGAFYRQVPFGAQSFELMADARLGSR
jgi:hypothetical protein